MGLYGRRLVRTVKTRREWCGRANTRFGVAVADWRSVDRIGGEWRHAAMIGLSWGKGDASATPFL